MSNSKSNREQNQVIELTPEQQDCGRALASHFIVSPNTETPQTAAHGQHGQTAAEYRRLLSEGSATEPLPERNRVPQPSKRAS
jgi:hypothetical protein